MEPILPDNSTRRRPWARLVALLALAGLSFAANAQDCSDYPGGILDGDVEPNPPSQLQIDRTCTIRNYPASNPLRTNFSFLTRPNRMSASWSWRKTLPAAWAISACIASSFSSFLPNVCGL
jgi:hypothetical protein